MRGRHKTPRTREYGHSAQPNQPEIFALTAPIVYGLALFVIAIVSNFNGFLIGMAISGLGFGMYVAVDLALVAARGGGRAGLFGRAVLAGRMSRAGTRSASPGTSTPAGPPGSTATAYAVMRRGAECGLYRAELVPERERAG
jgi:hypothetical protein